MLLQLFGRWTIDCFGCFYSLTMIILSLSHIGRLIVFTPIHIQYISSKYKVIAELSILIRHTFFSFTLFFPSNFFLVVVFVVSHYFFNVINLIQLNSLRIMFTSIIETSGYCTWNVRIWKCCGRCHCHNLLCVKKKWSNKM